MSNQTSIFDALGEDGKEYLAKVASAAGPTATDAATRKAEEHKIPLEDIKGTGQNGTITARDVSSKKREIDNEKARERAKTVGNNQAGVKEPDEYPDGRFVSYAGHRIEVPDRTMKLEAVREQLLEEQFPELTKDNSELIYDKDKNMVVPVLRGHKKGSVDQPIAVHRVIPDNASKRPVFYVLGEDGVYVVRSTQAGQFVARVEPEHAVAMEEGFRLKVPKITPGLMQRAVRDFRDNIDVERMVNFVWSEKDGTYYLQFPEQVGGEMMVRASATVETDDEFIVLQMHSHCKMSAFFSATDDADEVRTGLYGVVGRLDRPDPEFVFRFSCGGIFAPAHPSDVVSDWNPDDYRRYIKPPSEYVGRGRG